RGLDEVRGARRQAQVTHAGQGFQGERGAQVDHLQAGAEFARQHADRRAEQAGSQLFIGGEMGIGNTTAAAAMACALLDAPVSALVGPGTGLDASGVAHKAAVIERALA
ncbi:nicotinate-nucleotide--dimethylbenzimidazole phosphoribosyltransferase, partial [Pseudomonas aeruginosa]